MMLDAESVKLEIQKFVRDNLIEISKPQISLIGEQLRNLM